ncbi:MAG: Phosphoribosyl 1,2-cyclic phosphodiesterase [Segetibacter sp.]|nr:Phosphoribosyl 1,2-cyclic phosphodiesterase [Segetibacter sp.]
MSLFITSLNSGSNGNCYYIGNGREAILVDAGISCREIEKRMKRLGLSMQKLKAVFVSHEHTDHIKGICGLSKKFQLPVYITQSTLVSCPFTIEENRVKHFTGYKPIMIGNLSVTAFPKLHDACDPYSFVIADKDVKVGVFTDIGSACSHLISHFKQCHAAFLEANYDDEMLEQGSYPYHLKRRIRGGKGHLSNKQALEIFSTHKPSFMSHLVLSHLSKNNNCPTLVKELFNKDAGTVKIVVASRFEETQVIQVNGLRDNDGSLKHKNVALSQLQFSFV